MRCAPDHWISKAASAKNRPQQEGCILARGERDVGATRLLLSSPANSYLAHIHTRCAMLTVDQGCAERHECATGGPG